MPFPLRAPTRPRLPRPRLGTRIVRPAAGGGGSTTPPTAVTSADLVEGSGTRSFSAVTTQAGDYLVIGVQVEFAQTSAYTPSATGVTFPGSATVDSGQVGSTRGRALIWVGTDSAGGSRTVTITPSGTTGNYRARLTVVRGSTGPSGSGASSTAQTVSVTRTGASSMMFYGVTDWSAGAVGTPTWTPGGSTTASQQGVSATYIFGRWDDSGAAGTASHGISSPSYTTPAVAVLEMLGTAGGGGSTVTGDATLAVTATLTAAAATTQPAAASIAATATLTPAGVSTQVAAASIAATATLTATAGPAAGASIAVTATLSTDAATPPYVVGTPTTGTGSATTTTALAWDAGTVAGDLLLMFVSQAGAQTISSTSLGLTQQQRVVASLNTATLTVLSKVLTSTDITAGSVTATFGASQRHAVTLVTVRNHSGFDLAGTGSSNGSPTSSVTVPALTPSAANTLIVAAVGGQVGTTTTDVTWTFASPLTKVSEVNSTGAVNRAFLTTATQSMPGPGGPSSSGPDTPTPSTTVDYAAFRVSVLGPGSAQTFTAAASVDVTATLTPAAVSTQTAAASVATTATLSPAATLTAVAAASISATATLTPTAARTQPAAASIATTATLTPGAVSTQLAAASLPVVATLTVSSGTTVTLPVTATLTPSAALTAAAAASVNATAALTPAATLTAAATASLAVTATLSPAAVRAQPATASLPVTATLTPTAVTTQTVTAVALAVTASLSVVGAVGTVATLNAVATLTVAAARTATVTATLPVTAALTTSARLDAAAAVSLAVTAALSPAGTLTARATATLAVLAGLLVDAAIIPRFTVGVLSSSTTTASSLTATSVAAGSITATSARGGPS